MTEPIAPSDSSDGGGHRAAKRALEIIEHVAASPRPVGLSELSRDVGLPKSSAHALARTLDDEGYLERDERGAYALGPRLLGLLVRLGQRLELPRVARPIMQELADELEESTILGIRQGTKVIYIEQVEAPQYIRYAAPLGEPRPLHATSIGKIHLASMRPDAAEALLRKMTLEAYTKNTRVDIAHIVKELASIRRQGYAVNREESVAGVAAIAAPIHEGGEPDGRVIAGLSLAGPADRMRQKLADAPARLLDAARRIGAGTKAG